MEKKIMQEEFFKPEGLEMSTDKEKFGLELKTYRLRQGLTQQQLGEKWGVSRYTIMRCETGKNLSWEIAYRIFSRLAREIAHEEVIM